MKKAMLYVHGKGGNAAEADFYTKLCPGYDVIGASYTGDLPWVAQAQIKAAYDALTAQYDAVSIITNSIGTFFAMLALQHCAIEKAYCISPILDMECFITDRMLRAGICEAELKEKQTIPTNFGEPLSWQYLCYVREHPISWQAPTAILYARNDSLIDLQTVEAFARKHHASLTVYQDGEHWFHTPQQLAFLEGWLRLELGANGGC